MGILPTVGIQAYCEGGDEGVNSRSVARYSKKHFDLLLNSKTSTNNQLVKGINFTDQIIKPFFGLVSRYGHKLHKDISFF